ncbi:hypothetical protein [Cohnella cholangitidis]|uniref:Uncharacterized protein n=1 Tax=Cohnella cholangitidis TaxID=2598458 RepID=A0A7G5BTZ8_9BACL|nr:hypothetical protein [Cohnella cholangitidis]QMV40432.1 hypothetical protein FPL14_03865 [Cohnella cholangitidis]
MEELISFLTNNFHFVIIAIGIIYSLFFRKSQQEQRRPNRMPDFGGGNQRTEQPKRAEPRAPAPQREQTIRAESRRSASRPATIGRVSTRIMPMRSTNRQFDRRAVPALIR